MSAYAEGRDTSKLPFPIWSAKSTAPANQYDVVYAEGTDFDALVRNAAGDILCRGVPVQLDDAERLLFELWLTDDRAPISKFREIRHRRDILARWQLMCCLNAVDYQWAGPCVRVEEDPRLTKLWRKKHWRVVAARDILKNEL